MATPLDREGIFRAIPLEFVIRPPKDGKKTVMVGTKFQITEHLEGKEWKDWREFGMECFGDFCVVKTDGTINTTTVEFLRDGLGWDGQSVGVDKLNPCQLVVKPDEYEGKTRYRPEWINPYDYVGQGMAKATPDDEKGFFVQYGAQLRAICGAKSTSAPKPAGAPTAPPARGAAPSRTAAAPPPRRQAAAGTPASNGAGGGTATLVATTRDEAWNHVAAAYEGKGHSQDVVAEKFYDAVDKVGKDSGKAEAQFGPEQWHEVAEDASIPF